MAPALTDGDRVIVLRRWPRRWLRKGQIAIWHFPEFIPALGEGMFEQRDTRANFRSNFVKKPASLSAHDGKEEYHSEQASNIFLIKRIIGLSNDQISTHISDVQYNFRDKFVDLHDQNGNRDWLIPPGHCFIKGDSIGLDSTILGPVPLEDCIGIVLTKIQK